MTRRNLVVGFLGRLVLVGLVVWVSLRAISVLPLIPGLIVSLLAGQVTGISVARMIHRLRHQWWLLSVPEGELIEAQIRRVDGRVEPIVVDLVTLPDGSGRISGHSGPIVIRPGSTLTIPVSDDVKLVAEWE